VAPPVGRGDARRTGTRGPGCGSGAAAGGKGVPGQEAGPWSAARPCRARPPEVGARPCRAAEGRAEGEGDAGEEGRLDDRAEVPRVRLAEGRRQAAGAEEKGEGGDQGAGGVEGRGVRPPAGRPAAAEAEGRGVSGNAAATVEGCRRAGPGGRSDGGQA